VVECLGLQNGEAGQRAAPERVIRAPDYQRYPGQNYSPGTHGAGLLGHVEDGAFETPVAERGGGLSDGKDFRVGGGILEPFHHVVRRRDDPTLVDYYGTDRYFAFLGGGPGLGQRPAHEELVSVRGGLHCRLPAVKAQRNVTAVPPVEKGQSVGPDRP